MESRETLKNLCRELGIRVNNGVFASDNAEKIAISAYLSKHLNKSGAPRPLTIAGTPRPWKWIDVAVALRMFDL
jgi:hypothetical protein